MEMHKTNVGVAVETRFSYNGTWTGEGIKRRYVARTTKKCAFCGKPFKHPQRYYCSRDCAEKFFFEYHEGIWSEFRAEVLKRDNNQCRWCGKVGNEVDHIVELDRGGTNRLSNLQTLCHDCHAKKTASYIRKKARAKKQLHLPDMLLVNPDNLISPPQEIITRYF